MRNFQLFLKMGSLRKKNRLAQAYSTPSLTFDPNISSGKSNPSPQSRHLITQTHHPLILCFVDALMI
jgi:hypothetical protein